MREIILALNIGKYLGFNFDWLQTITAYSLAINTITTVVYEHIKQDTGCINVSIRQQNFLKKI